ncbi:hypothetical protein A2160_02810 [Candidatus Beckwithbacteria bacterium RBG_13_42_9]|uniref:Glycosyl transferase family 1 domain-containing protein n=1 Tax=Candidatus Beckwithbacteria bacterium RBG_13_42_9 TaxID=1797457 RepID=A0A1F5E7K7_9BACT|nr:MAG: hypothetical protein A2160_02810 [Candidatus Beckwithbacteria bacterium RBG_13_42_9]
MRILLVTEFYSSLTRPIFSGGVETRTFFVAKYLAQRHQVIVIARKRKGEKRIETRGNLKIYRLGSDVNNLAATVLSLFKRSFFIYQSINKGTSISCDLVEGSNYVTFLPAFLIGLIKGIPKVAWYPDVLIGEWHKYFSPVLMLFGEIAERFFLRLPWDYFLAISKKTAQKLVENGVNNKKITVIPCGVSKEWFNNKFSKFKEPTLCVISRLLTYKRIEDVIKALANLKKEFPKLRLIIIGEGPQERVLQRLIEQFGLKSRVKFYRQVPEEKLIRLLSKSHLFIHPSIIEGFGIVLVEAAAAGTPFVAAKIPTSEILAKKLKSGIVIDPGDIRSLDLAINKYLTNKKSYKEKQLNGLKFARDFTWDKLVEQTAKVYEKITR